MHSKDWIPEFKSLFKKELENFIKFKRSNGYVYGDPICYRLKELDTFLLSLNQSKPYIDQEVYDLWITQCKAPKESTKAKYSGAIITFCEYLRMTGHENIIQPDIPKSFIHQDYIPYIFSDEEIQQMFTTLINKVRDTDDWNMKTFYSLFCLYYGCGLRKSEALNLKIKDVSYSEKSITILDGKNKISRIIPLSESNFKQLSHYISMNKYDNKESYIFTDINGKHFKDRILYEMYHQLLKDAHIPIRYDGKRQRIHDLRHLFAIKSLKQMEDKGFDLYTSLPILSVYLGHKHITETEYYLRLIKNEEATVTKKTSEYLQKLYKQKDEYYGAPVRCS